MATTNIYILRLAGGKWYIGKSDNPEKRYSQHCAGNGSSWTKKYTPLALEKVIPNSGHFDEDKYTKEYMSKYGIENVRGGSYCSEELDEIQTDVLNREIWGAQDKCSRCGRTGHFQKDCYARRDVSGNELDGWAWCCEKCDAEFDDYGECARHERYCGSRTQCFKCGKLGHYASSCYSKPTITCYTCGKVGHYSTSCYANKFSSKKSNRYYDSDSD